MKITVNGEILEIQTGASVSDVIKLKAIKTTMFAVEKNLQIIPKSQYDNVSLNDGDKIEIVNFVGGG